MSGDDAGPGEVSHARGVGRPGGAIAAVADQARGTTGAPATPAGRLGEAVAAVAVQNPTITAVGLAVLFHSRHCRSGDARTTPGRAH